MVPSNLCVGFQRSAKQRSIFDGYNVAKALAFVNLEMYSKVWQANAKTRKTKQSSEESEEDSDKDKKNSRRQFIKTTHVVQEEVLGRERQRVFSEQRCSRPGIARGGMGFARAGPA